MARICYQIPQEQGVLLSLKEDLVPALAKIFKDLDRDICLEKYTELHENVFDNWGIRSVEFNFYMQSEIIRELKCICGKCYITFESGIIVAISVKASDYGDGRLPNLPSSDEIIKSVLKYNKKPIIFPFTSPGLLLDTFVFFNDVDGVEAVLGAYKSAVGVDSIDCALNKLTEKEEVNGEMVALLLDFKNQHFGFNESQTSSLL